MTAAPKPSARHVELAMFAALAAAALDLARIAVAIAASREAHVAGQATSPTPAAPRPKRARRSNVSRPAVKP